MKKLFILLFAKVFNKLKVSSPALYGTIIAPSLIWLQTKMFDPEVIAFIHSLADTFPDQADTIAALLKWVPMILLTLTGTHTRDIIKQDKIDKANR